ncbi:hypothetical protein Tcan_02503 [Toxocara canis]|uniref:Uncharacterized protein n=1 Tax=Toxocara canis TaxID=6265 RepID=A0A0B2UQB1_TOXCA|nr:hypothetical protein Tcan_02503 [Toxocara canis]
MVSRHFATSHKLSESTPPSFSPLSEIAEGFRYHLNLVASNSLLPYLSATVSFGIEAVLCVACMTIVDQHSRSRWKKTIYFDVTVITLSPSTPGRLSLRISLLLTRACLPTGRSESFPSAVSVLNVNIIDLA